MPANPTKAQVESFARELSDAFGVPVAIILSVIDFESNFAQWGPDGSPLGSSAGALGLMQIMPGGDWSKGLDIGGDWHDNMVAGVKELAWDFRQTNNWHDAYAAYNGGLGNYREPKPQRNATTVIEQAKSLYGWQGGSGNPNPDAHFDPAQQPPVDPHHHDWNPERWVSRFSNGKVPDQFLVPIGIKNYDGSQAMLRPDAAASWFAMVAVAKKAGVDLAAGFSNGYRDYAWQQQLWNAYQAGTGGQAAEPGHSNHGYGIAFDIRSGTAAWDWIAKNGKRFGWFNDVSGDTPHFDFQWGGAQAGGQPVAPNQQDQQFISQVVFSNGHFSVDSSLAPPGGVSGGGGGGGGSTGSGPFDFLAGLGQQGRVTKGEIAGVLRGFGLNPAMFADLIDTAVRQQWSDAEFEAHLYASDAFHQMFPGIFNGDGSLKVTPAQWEQLAYGDGGFADIAKNFGVNLDRDRIGSLIHGDVSPQEFFNRASIQQTAKRSDNFRKAFNGILAEQGHQPLGPGDWYNFLMHKGEAQIYDLYEAARLSSTLGIGAGAAEHVARGINQPGTFDPQALTDLISQVRSAQSVIGPELKQQGISEADLALIEGGQDPRGLAPVLQQILRNRQALAGAIPRPGTEGQSRTLALFPAQQQGA